MKYKGKQYLVTGVTSGLGKAVAEQLLIKGANVLGIGRDFSKIELNKVFDDNIDFEFFSTDLSNTGNLEEFIYSFCQKNKKFDGFIHCAGKEETIPLRMYKSDKIESLFRINVFSAIELIRIFSKKKISNNGSSFVLLSSVMGELGQPGKVGYCSTKSAILGAIRAAALELSKRDITINAVSPGVVNTPMTKALFDNLSQDNIDEIVSMHPLGIGNVSDVVPMILFLLSNGARWITGQNFKIDGGYSIQ